ncbi:MAG TPA: sensor domain-containing protein [Dehalococcoidia bacterium]|nr:sensor domain-containing protein [Dehalococcoidia bacterium]
MSELFAPTYGRYHSPLARIFAPVVAINTYARMIFLAAMFPLGLTYFVVLVVAGAVGGSLIWTFVGPVVLIVAMFLSRWAGDLEAFLVHNVSQVDFRRPPTRLEPGLTWRQQLTTRLIDPSTWTGLLYLMVQFPVGIGMFVAITVLGAVSGTFITAPVAIAFNDEYAADFWTALDTPIEGMALVLPGVLCFLVLIHFTLLASGLHAGWARLMLGSRARVAQQPQQDGPPPSPEPPATQPVPPPPGAETLAAAPLTPPAIAPSTPIVALPSPPAVNPAAGDVATAEPLTARERDVLGLLSFGYSNADIAETLVLSEGTVKTHVKRVLGKLGVHNRTEAALYARDHNVTYSPPVEEAPVVRLTRRAP